MRSSYYRFFLVPAERTVLNKERLAGYYRLSAYFLAKCTTDWPTVLLLPTWFVTITYWLSGINYNFLVYLQYVSITILTASLTHVSEQGTDMNTYQ